MSQAPPLVGGSRAGMLAAACAAGLLLAIGAATGVSASAAALEATHVHGVAFDVGDGALLLGTHVGLYRLGPRDAKARKVGTGSYDLMGLSAIGPRTYVASGHPDAAAAKRLGLPSNLGLIRTDDGGKRWRSVSLLGGADFHVLRARGARVFAYDVTRGRLLASADGGRTWKGRALPRGTVDLAVGVGVVAVSTSGGVSVSSDEGLTYRARSRSVDPGLLAWASPRVLLLAGADGVVRASTDGGRSFVRRGTAGGRPTAIAADGDRIAAVLDDGRVLLSRDGGRRFTVVAIA